MESCAEMTAAAVQGYLNELTTMAAISRHKHFRTLRAFFNWAVAAGLLDERQNPLRGFHMRIPKTLPRVPEGSVVRALMAACGDTWEGTRNKTLVGLLADSGLRIGEALRLRVEDVHLGERTLSVKSGKGNKDRTGFFNATAAGLLRAWISRPGVEPEDWLFADRSGRPLGRGWGTHLLHKLSRRAKLPRRWGPHSLRHFAATSILKQTGDLELTRRVLGHESLAMALRYSTLAQVDVSRKFRRASPLDDLMAGR